MHIKSRRSFLYVPLALLLAVIASFPGEALAHTPPLAAEKPEASAKEVFALIVTNNRSFQLARHDLRYADDDGAKYEETMRVLARQENVVLHTEFDSDSKRLYPKAVAKAIAPSVAAVKLSAAALAKRVQEANAAGKETEFYFVFAGHGDVEEGRGFLEFSDARFSADELSALLSSVPATRRHVILDSCNSFFAINARKPGGKRFLTAADAMEEMRSKLPSTGVFLSTSAKGEVYEWSEIQSGVFSHAVRSGLLGGADANGDGIVSYTELQTFVHVAVKNIKNPNVRPQVFSRGPGGKNDLSIFDARTSSAPMLTIDHASRRWTLTDKEAVPWIDLHLEQGQRARIRMPETLATGELLELGAKHEVVAARSLASELKDPAKVAAKGSPEAPALSAEDRIASSLALVGVKSASRGTADLFQNLFLAPFGPKAMGEHEGLGSMQAEEVYGVTPEDIERMGLLVGTLSELGKSNRHYKGAVFLGAAAVFGATGALVAANSVKTVTVGVQTEGEPRYEYTRTESDFGTAAIVFGIPTLAFGVAGISSLAGSSDEEDLLERYMQRGTLRPDQRVVETETRLREIRDGYASSRRTQRLWFGILGGLTVGSMIALSLSPALSDPYYSADEGSTRAFTGIVGGGIYALFFGALFAGTYFKNSREELIDQWLLDPSLRANAIPKPSVQVRPQVGWGSVGLSGSF